MNRIQDSRKDKSVVMGRSWLPGSSWGKEIAKGHEGTSCCDASVLRRDYGGSYMIVPMRQLSSICEMYCMLIMSIKLIFKIHPGLGEKSLPGPRQSE